MSHEASTATALGKQSIIFLKQILTRIAEERLSEAGDDARPRVVSDRSGVRLKLSGQVSQALLYADNGEQDKAFPVDNDNSGSRIGFLGEASWSGWTLGVALVIGVEINSTDEIKFDDANPQGGQFGEGDIGGVRRAHWYIEHPSFGMLSLGQGDEAGESASEADLSGTALIAQSGVAAA